MTRRNPTIEDVKEVAASIRARRELFSKASDLHGQYFLDRFTNLPQNLRDQFISTREQYFTSLEDDQTRNPELNKYYKRAARRFHPDAVGDDSKKGLFQSATDAYTRGDLPILQSLVLQDYAEDVDHLSERDKEFLVSEYSVIERVADTIGNQAVETIVTAAELYKMSDSMFLGSIMDAIKHMRGELQRRGTPESPQRPSLLEGK